MEHQDKENLIKRIKRQPIIFPGNTAVAIDYGKDEIHQLIPHRAPFSLLDKLLKIDLGQETLEAVAKISADDPVFKGHFPDDPVYPGVLQIEMMGQAGLCLAAFVQAKSTDITLVKPIKGLFTRVHNAGFLSAVYPGNQLRVVVRMVEHDDFLGIVCGQILHGNKIISHSISEVYFAE